MATLGDGGVYDNLGVHGIRQMDNILVSDASSPLRVDTMPIWRFWTTRVTRAMDTAVEQTRALRRSQLMEQLIGGHKKGALWTLTTDPRKYIAERRFEVKGEWGTQLGSIGTRLREFPKTRSVGSSTGCTFRLTLRSEATFETGYEFLTNSHFHTTASPRNR